MKVQRVYDLAEREERPVEDVAIERFGSLEEWDKAVEEKEGSSASSPRKKRIYGLDLKNPNGESASKSAESNVEPRSHPRVSNIGGSTGPSNTISQDELNKLKSKALKAKMFKAANAEELEEEYQRNLSLFQSSEQRSSSRKTQKPDDSLLENDVSGIVDARKYILVIAYFLRKQALSGSNEQCNQCQGYHVVAKSEYAMLVLPETVSMVDGHCYIIPVGHVRNTLELEDYEWEEIRNFMKSLVRYVCFSTHN
jgi:hypothetical protein